MPPALGGHFVTANPFNKHYKLTPTPMPSRKASLYSSFAVFILLAMSMAIRGGFSYGIAMLWVGGLAILFSKPRPQFSGADYWIVSAFLVYFLSHYAINLYHRDIAREYDLPLRFLLALPVLLFLKRHPPKPCYFWAGMAIGLLAGFALIAWQFFYVLNAGEFGRPSIHLGNMAMVLGLMCFSGWRWALSTERKGLWFGVLLLGGFAGILSSVLTGTRGAWLIAPFALLALLIDLAEYLRWSAWKVAGFALSGALLLSVVAYHNPIIKGRFDLAVKETQLFFEPGYDPGQKAADTSVGQRWLMWSNAVYMIPLKPWLGWGKEGYLQYKNERILRGEVLPQIAKYTDAHNDYLDALAKRGLVGLFILLQLFLAPLFLFASKLFGQEPIQRSYAVGGIIMVVGYMINGLTCTFMTINMNIMLYSILTVILWSLLTPYQPEGIKSVRA
jgi:O-antigen ligase